MAWIRMCGGKSLKTYLAPINTLALTSPSDTATSTTTKRTFAKNSYVKGLFSSNYYLTTVVSSYSITNNRVTFTSTTGYGNMGIGFVLNSNVKPEKTYTVDARVIQNGASNPFGIMFYKSDGTYINTVYNTTFTVPSDADYVVVLCTGIAGTTSIFEVNTVTEVTN